MASHAQVPTPLVDEVNAVIRVYFATRPEPGRTLTSFVDLDLHNPTRILHVSDRPILEPGKPGTFDEHGVMPSCAMWVGKEVFLYYSGWSRSVGVPYTNSTGLAVSDDGGISFHKISEGPILSKSIVDPYSATSPFVMRTNDEWRMWYCSGTGWIEHAGKQEHVYDIKLAKSDDGIRWRATGEVALPSNEDEQALTRPWVFFHDRWYMCYCHRKATDFRDGSGAYRLGVARSTDLNTWEVEQAGCKNWPREDWNDKTQAYPAIAQANNIRYLFSNGNGFGASGFGVWLGTGATHDAG